MTDNSPEKLFTLCLYSENTVGLVSRVSVIFTRRCVNIESISVGACSIEGVTKWVITAKTSRRAMEKIAAQVERCIDVLKVFVFDDEEIIYQEVAIYKVATAPLLKEHKIEEIIRKHSARILDITDEYTVIEKTGHYSETEALLATLKPYGLKQFERSGRVIVTKSTQEAVTEFLEIQSQRLANNTSNS